MPKLTVKNVRFCGISSCIPKTQLSNLDDCPEEEKVERERLVRNIGIKFRRVCTSTQFVSDLAFAATENLITQLKWDKSDIDALILITQSSDYLVPGTAVILQHSLGLSNKTIAFDVNLGCSGYPFGLHLLGSMISNGGIKKALLIIGDKTTKCKDPLFSDAASATALAFDENAPEMFFDLNTDGSGYQSIIRPVGGEKEPYRAEHFQEENKESDRLILKGTEILSFSTQKVPILVKEILEYSKTKADDIDLFIFHQANKLINETIIKKLKIDSKKAPSTLELLGNTSGASLPVTMSHHCNNSQSIKDKVLFTGFGVGLSWGAALIDTSKAVFPKIVEI